MGAKVAIRRLPLCALAIYVAAASAGAAAPDRIESYIPQSGLGGFITENFDIRTINSSLNPRRTASQSRFADLGLKITSSSERSVVLENDLATYSITIIGRGDYNKDGIEDVFVCFEDLAKQGTMDAIKPLVLTKYSRQTRLIAIALHLTSNQCPSRPAD